MVPETLEGVRKRLEEIQQAALEFSRRHILKPDPSAVTDPYTDGNEGNLIGEEHEDGRVDSVDELREQFFHHKYAEQQFMDEVAACPAFFDVLRPWMVDVKGCNAQFNEEDMLAAVSDATQTAEEATEAFREFIHKAGPLPTAIQGFIEAHGFTITDRGGGGDCWHVGTPCTESECRRLCTLLYLHFKKAIDAGLIRVVRHWWGWRLKDDKE